MSMEGHNDVKRVQEATDLVRLIGEHLQLRSAGREMVGLCPFHNDKAPSMRVSAQKQIFKCFACGAGGDCFSFMMKYHRMEFREALQNLAERAGITLTPFRGQKADGENDGVSQRKQLSEANDKALAFFRRTLADAQAGQAASAYVAKRGIAPEMVEAFQLGAAPDSWDALAGAIAARKADTRPYVEAGLIAPRSGGGFMDKLRHRLIFPIHDELGRVVAFGGRVLPDSVRDEKSDAKYLNSPETALFHKSSTLYGLFQAKKTIIDTKTAILVEGYMDVIACHQHGASNVIAALGTAFTPQHAEKLRRYCDRLVFMFDGDAAGQKAADRAAGVIFEERAVEIVLSQQLDVAIVVLPGTEGAKDADDILSSPGGREKFDALVARAEDALSFLFKKVAAEADRAGSLAGRQRVIEEFFDRLARLGITKVGGVRLSMLTGRMALLLGVPKGEIEAQLRRLAKQHAARPAAQEAVKTQADAENPNAGLLAGMAADAAGQETALGRMPPARLIAERQLIAAVLRDPSVLGLAVPGGASLDEAIAPGLMSLQNREAWAWTLRRAGSSSALPPIAQLEQEGREDLKALVMQADEELDAAGAASPEQLRQVVRDGAALIVKFAREGEKRQRLRRMLEG